MAVVMMVVVVVMMVMVTVMMTSERFGTEHQSWWRDSRGHRFLALGFFSCHDSAHGHPR
jgi:hypothetical protein